MRKNILLVTLAFATFGVTTINAKINSTWASTGINSHGASLSSVMTSNNRALFGIVFSTKAQCQPYLEIVYSSPDKPDTNGMKEIDGKVTIQIDTKEKWLIPTVEFTVSNGYTSFYIYPDKKLNVIDEIIAGNTLKTTYNGSPDLTVSLKGSGKATKKAAMTCVNAIKTKRLSTKDLLKKAGFYR